MQYRILATVPVVVFGLMLASPAFAAQNHGKSVHKATAASSAAVLHPIIPEGLPKHNAAQAWTVFQSRVDYDQGLGAALARSTGSGAYNAADYQPMGYSNGAPPGSTNSGVTSTGALSSAQDTANCNIRSRMLVVVNIHTQARAYICVNCANPRLFTQSPPVFHRFSQGTVVPYFKSVTATKTVMCPNGTSVTVNVAVTIQGTLTARTWGVASGIIKARLTAAFNAQVRVQIGIKCSAPPGCGCVPSPITGSISKQVTSGGFDGLKLNFHVTITHPHGVSGWVGDEQVAVGSSTPIGPNGTTQPLFTGDVVQVCEDQGSAGSKGLTIGGNGQWCQTQTVGSANILFTFVDTPVPASSPPTSTSSPAPPASSPSPSIISVTTLNDVDAGGSSPNFCATGSMPGSDSGTLTFSAVYGSFSLNTFTISGQQQECVTYFAPSEVPPGGRDTVTVTLRDNNNGNSATPNSQSFPIGPHP